MVTVATKIEAPMKLTIETGAKVNILGLGDIAVPCLLIALALRFDLWMCYQRLVKHVRDVPGFKSDSETESEPGKEVAAASNSRYIAVRAPYVDVSVDRPTGSIPSRSLHGSRAGPSPLRSRRLPSPNRISTLRWEDTRSG